MNIKSKNKKITILYVLKILKDGSDKDHPISQAVITRTINMLGIECDRKTISRDIDCLIKFGYDIRKKCGGGCYFNSPEFSNYDVENILNGIDLISDIPYDYKKELNNKIKKLVNINQRYRRKNEI